MSALITGLQVPLVSGKRPKTREPLKFMASSQQCESESNTTLTSSDVSDKDADRTITNSNQPTSDEEIAKSESNNTGSPVKRPRRGRRSDISVEALVQMALADETKEDEMLMSREGLTGEEKVRMVQANKNRRMRVSIEMLNDQERYIRGEEAFLFSLRRKQWPAWKKLFRQYTTAAETAKKKFEEGPKFDAAIKLNDDAQTFLRDRIDFEDYLETIIGNAEEAMKKKKDSKLQAEIERANAAKQLLDSQNERLTKFLAANPDQSLGDIMHQLKSIVELRQKRQDMTKIREEFARNSNELLKMRKLLDQDDHSEVV